MVDSLDKKWYVLRTASGKEDKVKSYVENEIHRLGYSDYIDEVLVPRESVVQFRNGKKVVRDRLYYPGYVIMRACLIGEIIHAIKSLTFVSGFLGEVRGGEPVPLRKSEVSRMLGKVDEFDMGVEDVNIPFSEGDTVKVVDGPFSGFNGSVEAVNEEKRKLSVAVRVFGRRTPLELGYMQVEKV